MSPQFWLGLQMDYDVDVAADLIVPSDLKDRVAFALLVAMNATLTLAEMGEIEIK